MQLFSTSYNIDYSKVIYIWSLSTRIGVANRRTVFSEKPSAQNYANHVWYIRSFAETRFFFRFDEFFIFLCLLKTLLIFIHFEF